MKTLSVAESRELDRRVIEEAGISGEELMGRAGQGVAEIALEILDSHQESSVLLIAGTGNNGGDVFSAATFLSSTHADIEVWICGYQDDIQGDAQVHLQKMIESGVTPSEMTNPFDLPEKISSSLIVDGLLGTGADGAPRDFMSFLIDWMNKQAQTAFLLSIDVPSGINGDTGVAEGSAIRADLTATMTRPKTGLIAPEAIPYIGNLRIIDLGIPPEYIAEVKGSREVGVIHPKDLRIPRRERDTHKHSFGHTLLIGGGMGTSGAIALAAKAALRSGAGAVSILTPKEVYPIVAQAAGPEVMVHPFSSIEKIPALISSQWKQVDSILVGPGMNPSEDTKGLVEKLLQTSKVALVLDAGALCVSVPLISHAQCPVVLTPHPGEFKRLFGWPVTDRLAQTRAAAYSTGKTLILKGAGTLVAQQGEKPSVNITGNPGMATAGSGDILAGMVTSFLGQGMESFQAAKTAVYLHGLAGDLAAAELTQHSMIASDIIEALPKAIRRI